MDTADINHLAAELARRPSFDGTLSADWYYTIGQAARDLEGHGELSAANLDRVLRRLMVLMQLRNPGQEAPADDLASWAQELLS